MPAAVSAQGDYFGQNKVQYRTFDFKVLKTEHFDIYYYPEEEEAARMAARMAERWYGRLSKLLVHELRGRQPLILYASAPHFRQTNTIMGSIGEGTGGVTEAFKRRIVLPFAGPLQATDHVLGHELVHAFQYDITGTNVNTNTAGALALPLWFIEGMAEYLSIGPVDPHTAMWMRDAARREKLPSIDELDNPRYFPYRYGHALWAFIGGKYGDKAVASLLRAGAVSRGYKEAFEAVLGVDTKELTRLWHEAEFNAYRPVAEATTLAGKIARPVIVNEPKGPRLNVSPELSPDGSQFMFFSERDLFSVDLYLADSATGKVIRKITDTATDPHYESLQFLGSAGAWHPSGERIVVPAISRGQPVLAILNTSNSRREREIRLEGVDEVLNPTWSRDGRLIAFSGIVGGLTDLFVYDLQANSMRRLTNDPFAELDPAFSPDGRQIAFATDRFTTNLETLDIGEPRIATIDLQSGGVREVGGFTGAKNIGPQWTPDGSSLYFLSDRAGITNLYRIPAAGGQPAQLTNLVTGVSGITALSPAMSASAGRVIFSAYEDDGYNVYALETETQLAGMPLVDLPRHAGVLPPRTAAEGPVAATLASATAALPPPAAVAGEPEPYRPRLSLDFAGQPTVGVGADPFGTYATGGVTFLFSDMLGNHTVGTTAQMTSRFDEFGGSLFYLNRTRRWNWGIGLDQTPYVSRAYQTGVINTPGDRLYVEREFRILQTDRSLSGVISYPFSRAMRVEANAGLRQLGLKQDVRENVYSLTTGQLLDRTDQEIARFDTLNLGQASGALVYDTSIFGVTSPIRGSRSRLEYSQSVGSLNYSGVLADVRTYVMPVRPATFALRGIYYGRYGGDADDPRLPTLYLGYSGLVRGYDPGSFEPGECGVTADGTCPIFDRLIGSRIALANAELRMPLWSLFGGRGFYGPLPVEVALFGDMGLAWGGRSARSFGEARRDPVTSIGTALRANLFGFAVLEVDYVKPLQRDRGWLWQFSLRPGF
ncbi:MAG TPA: BamA/TamA family outer membrane protein [Vicinamibacterales bacterium]|nr:BamA/TamA family outer membrane protein [Vicinamibacterales bacterium]